jgi:small subunit ribosomal protein S16
MTDPSEITIDGDKAVKWLQQGAIPSDTARGLLKKTGVWEKFVESKGKAE